MPRPQTPQPRSRPLVLLALVMFLAGCSGTVAVTEPDPPADVRAICAAVMADLPQTVLDQKRRTVQPGVLTAAWGDPPITIRCGVEQPAAMRPTSECFEVNGVGWIHEQGQGGALFTTLGRPAMIEMGVPDDYAPEANALVDVAAVISAHDPLSRPCL